MADIRIDDLVFLGEAEADFDEAPTPAEKCIRGSPVQRTWNYFTSGDEAFFVGIWEAEPGCWTVEYTEHEFCRILSGRSVLRDAGGAAREVRAGDSFTIPRGFTGQWEVLETTRKIYVIYQP